MPPRKGYKPTVGFHTMSATKMREVIELANVGKRGRVTMRSRSRKPAKIVLKYPD